MKLILIVGLGGFLGTISRYLIQLFTSNYNQSSFPFATLFINLLGCFLIGVLYSLSNKYNILNNELKLFFTTGFCGGFTTFSSFSMESFTLLKNENYYYLFLYIFLSVVIGIFFTFVGYSIFKN